MTKCTMKPLPLLPEKNTFTLLLPGGYNLPAHRLIETKPEKMYLRHDRFIVSSPEDHMSQYGMDARLLRNLLKCCVNIMQKTPCTGLVYLYGVCDRLHAPVLILSRDVNTFKMK